MTTFQDIFKSSFLERLDSVSLLDTALALVLAFLLGLFIFLVYKRSYSGVMYSPSFGVTLIALTLITTLLILAVTSNIVLSLGMVGALSIVRFRTAIKEPMDIAFLFWSIAAGIVLAAGLIPLAVLGSLFVGAVLLVFSRQKNGESPYILVVRCASPRDGGASPRPGGGPGAPPEPEEQGGLPGGDRAELRGAPAGGGHQLCQRAGGHVGGGPRGPGLLQRGLHGLRP